MKPLIVLLSSFVIALFALYGIEHHWEWMLAGNISMSVMLLFTAIGHFALKESMAKMLPPSIPYRHQIILVTGFLEMLGAIGLVITPTRTLTAVVLLVFFVLILPANIYATTQKLNHETGANDGPGLKYLWFRIPLQLLFILWITYFSLLF